MTKHITTSTTFKKAISYGMNPGKTVVISMDNAKAVSNTGGIIVWSTSGDYPVHTNWSIDANKLPDLIRSCKAKLTTLQGERRILVSTDDCQEITLW